MIASVLLASSALIVMLVLALVREVRFAPSRLFFGAYSKDGDPVAMNRPFWSVMFLGVLSVIFSGCDEDEQEKANRSQAQVAEASRELVQADAKARGEIVALQRDMQQGQADLGRQRDQLEKDRRQYADQRNRDPILANTILDVGTILACLLPLVLCIVLALGPA